MYRRKNACATVTSLPYAFACSNAHILSLLFDIISTPQAIYQLAPHSDSGNDAQRGIMVLATSTELLASNPSELGKWFVYFFYLPAPSLFILALMSFLLPSDLYKPTFTNLEPSS